MSTATTITTTTAIIIITANEKTKATKRHIGPEASGMDTKPEHLKEELVLLNSGFIF